MILDINDSTIAVVFALLIFMVAGVAYALYRSGHYLDIITAQTSWLRKLLYMPIRLLIAMALASARYVLTGKGLI